MQLQKTRSKMYFVLPSGTLIVEPNPELLAVRSILLTAADQYLAALNATSTCEALQQIQRARIGPVPLCLSGLGRLSVQRVPAESDPSKSAMVSPFRRDLPGDEMSHRPA